MILPAMNTTCLGQLAGASSANEARRLSAVYKSLALTKKLPSQDFITYEELIAAKEGLRTLPNIDVVVWKSARQLVACEVKARGSRKPHHKMLGPTALRIRISALCLMKEQPPLITPKYGCEFKRVYLVYCAFMLDSGNVTRWRDADIDASIAGTPKLLADITKAREDALKGLVTKGMKQSNENIRRFTKISRASINFSKLSEDNIFNNRHAKHIKLTTKSIDIITDECWNIATQCYTDRNRDGCLEKETVFVNSMVSKLKLILAFDYMLPIYDADFTKMYGSDVVTAAYEKIQGFRALAIGKDSHLERCHKAFSKKPFKAKDTKFVNKSTFKFANPTIDGVDSSFARRMRATGRKTDSRDSNYLRRRSSPATASRLPGSAATKITPSPLTKP